MTPLAIGWDRTHGKKGGTGSGLRAQEDDMCDFAITAAPPERPSSQSIKTKSGSYVPSPLVFFSFIDK